MYMLQVRRETSETIRNFADYEDANSNGLQVVRSFVDSKIGGNSEFTCCCLRLHEDEWKALVFNRPGGRILLEVSVYERLSD